ncbi:DUF4244 domain-containing protein [Nocardioidaceae bacterium SCSIO 66511]|nr:DUF4244 domain-containing protein [Nocardioidaceae bacterium SCSIO 66511]
MNPSGTPSDRGQATAEYAIGTVGAAGLAGVLVHLAGGDWFRGLIEQILQLALGLPRFPGIPMPFGF